VKELRDYFRRPGKGGFWMTIFPLLEESPQGPDLLAAPVVEEELRPSGSTTTGSTRPALSRRWRTTSSEDPAWRTAASKRSAPRKLPLEARVSRPRGSARRSSGRRSSSLKLRDFEDKLRRAANLHLEPDLNDGVVLKHRAAPRTRPVEEAKRYWQELLDGKYEWSSIAKQIREKELVK